MTGTALSSHPSAFSPAPVARFGAALAASAAAHWLLLAAPVTHLPWQGRAPIPDNAPMTVRLAPALVPTQQLPVSPQPEELRTPLLATAPAGGGERSLRAHSPSAAAQPGADAPARSPAPDPHYYPARDLDDYPRPLAPLRIGRPARTGAGEVRLELLIDERGVVRDVVFAGPAAPARVEEELRAALAATRFLPAQKNGRAVRSRIVLSISFAAAREQ